MRLRAEVHPKFSDHLIEAFFLKIGHAGVKNLLFELISKNKLALVA
jgi:hypothetical protein